MITLQHFLSAVDAFVSLWILLFIAAMIIFAGCGIVALCIRLIAGVIFGRWAV